MKLRVIACEPFKNPDSIRIEFIQEIMSFLISNQDLEKYSKGWFDVLGISDYFKSGDILLIYTLQNCMKPFNRMFQFFPIYGNFIISKLGKNGLEDLSNEEVVLLMEDLIIPQPNNIN